MVSQEPEEDTERLTASIMTMLNLGRLRLVKRAESCEEGITAAEYDAIWVNIPFKKNLLRRRNGLKSVVRSDKGHLFLDAQVN
jgi:hypothetical protein